MPIQDFLITFRSDTAGAQASIKALVQAVLQADAQINATLGKLGTNNALGQVATSGQAAAASIARMAASATPAAVGIEKMAAGVLSLGRGAKLTDEQVKALQARLRQIRTDAALGARAGLASPIGQGQLNEALRIVQRLREVGAMAGTEADRISTNMNRAFSRSGLIPQSLRNLPTALKTIYEKAVATIQTATAKIEALQQLPQNKTAITGQITATNQLIAAYQRMGTTGVNVSSQLAQLQSRLIQLRAANELLTQSTSGARSIRALESRAADLRLQKPMTQEGEISRLTQLGAVLEKLAARSRPVAAELANVRNKIRELNAAAASATALKQLTDKLAVQETALGDLRIRAGGIGKGGFGEQVGLRGIINTLEDMQRLGAATSSVTGKLQMFRAQFAALPPTLGATTAALLATTQALRQTGENLERFRTGQLSASQLTTGFNNSLTLMSEGVDGAGEHAAFFAERINALPASFGTASREFIRHTGRIATGIIIYDTLGRAIQGVASQIELITDLAREQIRFEAVIGDLGAEGQASFLESLGDIAFDTNTSMSDLAGQMDSVAFATDKADSAFQRQADSQVLLRRAGELTNITQRGLAEETENVLGIMSVFQLTTKETGDALGRMVALGDNSSVAIAAITDIVSEAGRSASAYAFDLNLLGSIGVQVFRALRGSASGSEIGSLLNTIFGKLGDPKIQQDITDLTQGIIKFRDETGNLRPLSDVFVEIFAAMKEGIIPAELAARVLDKFIPPLSPQTAPFVEIIKRILPDAMKEAGEVANITSQELTDLSDKLVSGPAERFSRAMIAIQAALVGLFQESVVDTVENLAAAFTGLAAILDGIPGQFLSIGVQLVTALLAIKGASKFIELLKVSFLGAGIRAAAVAMAMGATGTAAAVASPLVDQYGRAITTAGAAAGPAAAGTGRFALSVAGLGLAVKGLLITFAPFLALMAVFQTIDFFKGVTEQADKFTASLGRLAGPGTAAGLDALIAKLKGSLELDRPGSEILDIPKGLFVDPEIRNNIRTAEALRASLGLVDHSVEAVRKRVEELKALQGWFPVGDEAEARAAQIRVLEAALEGLSEDATKVTFDDLTRGAFGAGAAAEEAGVETQTYADILKALGINTPIVADALDELTESETRAADAARINIELSDARAAAMVKLTQQLREGTINVDEFERANANVGRASETAASFIANYGDQLSLIPGLQERIASTGEDAATALLNILLANPDTIDQSIEIIDSMIKIAEAELALAESTADSSQVIAASPITPRINIDPLELGLARSEVMFRQLEGGNASLSEFLLKNRPTPQLNLDVLRAQLKAYLTALESFRKMQASIFPTGGGIFGSAFRAATGAAGGALDQQITLLKTQIAALEKATTKAISTASAAELKAYRDQLAVLQGIRGDDARLLDATEKQAPQTALIDAGDLSQVQLQQAIAMARALQNAIPGANAEASDETLAIVRDAVFQQFIRGLDQRFLVDAIQALTDVEKKRLELEQQRLQDVTRNLITQVGPIQSLISSPVLSAGGGVLSGQGLNADPRLGNITINVPINWSGMSLPQLQEFIYKSISQAWIDAGRGG